MNERTQDQIIADMHALPKLPAVYATNMIYAQGFTLTDDLRADLKKRADLARELIGTTDQQTLRLTVRDARNPAEKIGSLTFTM